MDFGLITMHNDLLTDTCLTMSGMLLAKGFIDKWVKPENLFTSLWKRYIRLITHFYTFELNVCNCLIRDLGVKF